MVDHPVTLKEYVMPSLNTTRQDYMNDNNRKFGGSAKFNFRKYKTDKERLDEYLREKEESQAHIDRIKKTKEEKEKSENATNNKYYSIEQPTMRYKPRTDLERIYYTVNDYSYGKISKDIINEQLSKLHLNDLKKNNDDEKNAENSLMEKYKNLDENVIEELQTQKEFLNRQGYNEKNSETVKQIQLILSSYNSKNSAQNNMNGSITNSSSNEDIKGSKMRHKLALKNQINSYAAKKMMREYNTKTFFKAASVFSFNLNSYQQKHKFTTNSTSKDKNPALSAFETHKEFSKKSPKNEKRVNSFGQVNYISYNFNSSGSNNTCYNFSQKGKNYSSNSNVHSYTSNNFNINDKNSHKYNSSYDPQTAKAFSNSKSITTQKHSTDANKHFIGFNEMDEPYNDEISLNYTNNNGNHNLDYNSMKNQTNNDFQKVLNTLCSRNQKTEQSRNLSNRTDNLGACMNFQSDFKTSETNGNDLISILNLTSPNNFDFNPFSNKHKEKYDPKSLLYLKKISAYSTLPNAELNNNNNTNNFTTNIYDSNNSNFIKNYNEQLKPRKAGSISMINKKTSIVGANPHTGSSTNLNKIADNMLLKQTNFADIEDMRKCNLFSFFS